MGILERMSTLFITRRGWIDGLMLCCFVCWGMEFQRFFT
jgi:hypothetical protein